MPHNRLSCPKQRNWQRPARIAWKESILRDAVIVRGLSRHTGSMEQFFAMRNDADRLGTLDKGEHTVNMLNI